MTRETLPQPSASNRQVKEYVDAVQRGLKSQFVVPADKGWQVKRASASRASGQFATNQEAVSRAREIARNQRTEVFVFDRDGRLTERTR